MTVSAIELGATLYMPCTRGDLAAALARAAASGLRSAVLCVEDSVHARDVPAALDNLAAVLPVLGAIPLAVFVRPRSAGMLEHILHLDGIGHAAGFVIPKAHADSLPAYLALPLHEGHRLMPTLETREVCDGHEMRRLRDQLLGQQDRILALRIGGNDLLQILGARRSATRTVYDGPLGPLIGTLVATFAPWGFELTAPVMENFANPALLAAEVERDLDHGLCAKTAIHPSQVPVIHAALAVPMAQLAEAQAILGEDSPAVFNSAGVMCEPATHARWARRVMARAEAFGTTGAELKIA
ncbi:HpcH/HpaI aldolase/citrate lyase family protein [Sphingomonas carotinifaciens]|uniref:HpcH/HpaI aldolase/citrate lyase family protein n=1 Tax=Sphingomonas TaxID=13687 RepID=UPI00315D3E6E